MDSRSDRPYRRLLSLLALSGIGLGGAGAAVFTAPPAASAMYSAVTKVGTLSKIDSKASFTFIVSKKSYVVKVDGMTRIKAGAKVVKFSSLRPGETVQVKGPLEMGEISATSVVIEIASPSHKTPDPLLSGL